MKIFQVISSLGNGGAEKLVVELSNELAKTHDITIISLKEVEDWMYPPKKIESIVRLIQFNKQKGFDIKVLYNLFALLKNEKPDVVHIHLEMPLYYFILLIPFFRKIDFYHTIHSTFELHQKLFKRLNLFLFYHRVINICLSKSIFEKFTKTFPRLKFRRIENGLKPMCLSVSNESVKKEIGALRTDSNTKVILFVGRLYYEKNIPLLLNVFSENRLNNIKLIIIGNGEIEVVNQVNEISSVSQKRILFLGSKENVVDYMNCADALILTSIYEGLPIVVLEALSMGLPVLSTPVGGVPDVITDGVNGFLAKSKHKQDIIEIIEKFSNLENHEIDKIRENNIRLFNEFYSVKVCADKHNELYKNKST